MSSCNSPQALTYAADVRSIAGSHGVGNADIGDARKNADERFGTDIDHTVPASLGFFPCDRFASRRVRHNDWAVALAYYLYVLLSVLDSNH